MTRKECACAMFVALFLLSAPWTQAGETHTIPIVIGERASDAERIAAKDLRDMLARLYPDQGFSVVTDNPKMSSHILVGTPGSLAVVSDYVSARELDREESFVVKNVRKDGQPVGIIAGRTGRAVLYGVYQLLEKLGSGFYLSDETQPEPRKEFSFDGWDLSDRPLVEDRIVFNWHNFLSGCTGWDQQQWLNWVSRSQKMGYNTIMVHAYGNNPMFTFSFNGIDKPVGYVGTTKRGRDWGNQHINDVRRMPGGDIFDSAEFGCAAALVSDDQRIEAKQTLMKKVLSFAEKRQMRVCFAIDVDTDSVLPQDMIETIPETDRFSNGRIWLPRPDRQGGYAFYKAQVKALFDLYPEVDLLAIWRRAHAAEWGRLTKPEQLPAQWQPEYEAHVRRNPAAAELHQSVCSFALSKVVDAFRRALNEIGRRDVRICTGSWDTSWVPAVAEFFPEEVTIMPLDSSCMVRYRGGSYFYREGPLRDLLNAKGRVTPIIWAHHDDGEYIGRPLHPHKDFHDTLSKLDARGFGIIHWMNRPLDLYFKSHSRQVWATTRNEPYSTTCNLMGRHYFGPSQADGLGDYLYRWAMDAPIFGRVTTDHFFRGNEYIPEPQQAVKSCRERLHVLESADTSEMTETQRSRLEYFKTLEKLIVSFCDVQEFAYRPAQKAIAAGKFAQARELLEKADPAVTMEKLSRLSQMAGADRGEEAMVVSLGTRWITDYIAARQAAGLEAVRINYGPTKFEPLAQGAGKYSFHIDPEGRYWSVRGRQETGHDAARYAPTVSARTGDGLGESLREIGETAIVVDSAATLAISPIVGLYKQLAPGDYSLTVYAGPAPGSHTCEVRFATDKSVSSRISVTPTKARFLRIQCSGSDQNRWCSIYEIRSQALDRQAVDKASASSHVAGCPAGAAVDGDPDTRWAAEGDHWIRMPLDPNKNLEEIDISWYQGETRQYKYTLQVSDDAQSWTELPTRTAPTNAHGKTHVLTNPDKPHVTLSPVKIPVHLASPALPQLRILPVEGSAIIYGLELVPLGGK